MTPEEFAKQNPKEMLKTPFEFAEAYHKAESEKPKEFELTFGGDFKCIIKIEGNNISCDKSMNGYGNPSELTEVKLLEQ